VVHNKLLTYQDKRYRYDAFGRTIEKRSTARGLQRFAYDAESRLIEVRNENGSVVRMTYDPLGRRIAKTEHGGDGYPLGETRFMWDGLRLLQEHRHSQTSLYIYQDEGYEPIARIDGSGPLQKIRYYHNDLNGLPEQLTEADGHTVWQATYRVWGNTLEEVREPYYIEEQNLRFQGQYLDREIGLHYNTFRFYDPDVGRFTTPDPIGLAGGVNTYLYADNPFGWIDPLGLTCGSSGKVHGNSHASKNPNHVYVIVDTKTGCMMKPGISGRPLNKNGTSPRANQQVNALNKPQAGRYKAVIVEKNKTRLQAKATEQKITDKHAARNNGNMPSPIHRNPLPQVDTRDGYLRLYGTPDNR